MPLIKFAKQTANDPQFFCSTPILQIGFANWAGFKNPPFLRAHHAQLDLRIFQYEVGLFFDTVQLKNQIALKNF